MSTPHVGQPAPDFELRDQFGAAHRLSSRRGHSVVVVVFFPFAFTPTCTSELAVLRDDVATFANDSVTTIGVSCDPMSALRVFAETESIAFPLLSDFWPHGAVSRSYGVFIEERGFANRGTFIIDRNGVLRWSVVTSPAEARSAVEYRSALATLLD